MKNIVGVGIVFCLGVIGLFYFHPLELANDSGKPSVRIKIAVSQTPLSSPFIVASHFNLFEKRNLNIEVVPCFGGVACAEALLNDEVDFATASESVVMFKSFEYQDIALLTCFVESGSDLKLLTKSISNIRSVSDLKGKRVGIVKASASEFYFDSLLIANNLKAMALERVYLPPQELNRALLEGQVDAVSVWEPYGYLLMSTSEEILNLSLDGIYQLTFNLLTRDATEAQLSDETVEILTVLENSIEWMTNNPKQAQDIVAKALDIPSAQLAWQWEDYTFRLSIGNALLSNLQLQSRWAIDSNLVEGSVPDFRQVLSPRALEQVLHSQVRRP
ncbi:ABC transporter substrate-binding protein [Vibrio sp. ZSDE26]|uniref:ABC transporter substrate-binding protein n=1 Tax=Vibrio amylolyticus TaxID=2847292 RepID=A0A9X1XGX6_9VIBR|nr:ABC transporter substrate-binding protein [Vibrio amylolyticus]MCK6261795.1 ABC transporter substrate-binding protein [Vibrio amylolyticus]